jgi:glycosyltransferase involved in cell wall biosynthesis
VFKPLAPAIIKDEKIELNWENRFIVLNVNRLQPRKQIPTTLRVFSMFSKGYNSCNNCKHRQPLNMTRCELCTSTRLTKHTAGKKDDVHLHIHSELKSSAMGVTFLDGIVPYAMQAGFETNDFGPILSLNSAPIQEVGEDTINILYNLADVNISTTVGEGAGLSFLEAAALGLPSIAPKHSAIPEMLGNFGDMIENVAVFTHKDHTGYFRPIVNEWEMVKALERYYTKWRIAGQDLQKNKAQITWAKKVFSWEDKRENLKNVLLKYATESQQAPSTAP